MSKIQAPWKFVEKYYTDDLLEREIPESKWSLSWLKNVSGDHVLSLGCGPNFFDDALFFNEFPKDFVGIDLNKNNINFLKQSEHPEVLKCKNILRNSNTKIELLVRDIRLAEPNFRNRFDTVYAMGVLGMFSRKEMKKIFETIHKYLKPKGKILDIDWTDCRLPKEKLREREKYDWYSEHGPTIRGIGNLLKNSGFEILKHEVYKVPKPEWYGWGKIYAYVGRKK